MGKQEHLLGAGAALCSTSEMYARYKRDGWDGWGNEYPTSKALNHRKDD